jgi:archaea-specific DNA-binding protein
MLQFFCCLIALLGRVRIVMHYRKDEMVIEMSERSGIVFVGNKMPMDYVLAIITGLSASDSKGITLKARGQAITTAVDAAEITRRRFLKDLKVSKIVIGTEEMPPREGDTRARMVSTIEIGLSKE